MDNNEYTIYCAKCGAEMGSNSRYCMKCGTLNYEHEANKNMKGYMIVAGINDKTNLETIELVNKYDNVYGVIGIQPEEVSSMTNESIHIIEDNIANPKIVGIGEIGLDYYWDD